MVLEDYITKRVQDTPIREMIFEYAISELMCHQCPIRKQCDDSPDSCLTLFKRHRYEEVNEEGVVE